MSLPPIPYSCSLLGHCEPNPNGTHPSLAACTPTCQARDSMDLSYLIYQYSPSTAVTDLPPSDQRIVLKRLTGADVSDPDRVATLLTVLDEAGYAAYGYRELFPYFSKRGELTAEHLVASGGIDAIDELKRRYPEGIPYGLVGGLTGSVALEYGVEGLDYLYEKLTVVERQYLQTEVVRRVLAFDEDGDEEDEEEEDQLMVELLGLESDHSADYQIHHLILDWLLLHPTQLRPLLSHFTSLKYLPYLLQILRQRLDYRDELLAVVGGFADPPVTRGFIEQGGVTPPFQFIWDRNDVTLLGQVIGYYEPEEIQEVVHSYLSQGGVLTGEERRILGDSS